MKNNKLSYKEFDIFNPLEDFLCAFFLFNLNSLILLLLLLLLLIIKSLFSFYKFDH